MSEKKVELRVTLTQKLIEWLEKHKPDHMSRSIALEHYFWIGLAYEKERDYNFNQERIR